MIIIAHILWRILQTIRFLKAKYYEKPAFFCEDFFNAFYLQTDVAIKKNHTEMLPFELLTYTYRTIGHDCEKMCIWFWKESSKELRLLDLFSSQERPPYAPRTKSKSVKQLNMFSIVNPNYLKPSNNHKTYKLKFILKEYNLIFLTYRFVEGWKLNKALRIWQEYGIMLDTFRLFLLIELYKPVSNRFKTTYSA